MNKSTNKPIRKSTKPSLRKEFPAEYTAWANAKSKAGSREITVGEDFGSFEAFLKTVGPKPSKLHSLDRIDNDGGYELRNLQWATKAEQSNNRRTTIFLEYDGNKFPDWKGESKPLAEWARLVGEPAERLRSRRRRGWSDDEIIEGDRIKGPKTFAQMSEYQLLRYEPWPIGQSERLELAFQIESLEEENRFEFYIRDLIARKHRYQDGFGKEIGLVYVTPGDEFLEDIYSDVDDANTFGRWVNEGTVTAEDFKKFRRKSNRYDQKITEVRKELKKWRRHLDRHLIKKGKDKAATKIRRAIMDELSRDEDLD